MRYDSPQRSWPRQRKKDAFNVDIGTHKGAAIGVSTRVQAGNVNLSAGPPNLIFGPGLNLGCGGSSSTSGGGSSRGNAGGSAEPNGHYSTDGGRREPANIQSNTHHGIGHSEGGMASNGSGGYGSRTSGRKVAVGPGSSAGDGTMAKNNISSNGSGSGATPPRYSGGSSSNGGHGKAKMRRNVASNSNGRVSAVNGNSEDIRGTGEVLQAKCDIEVL